MNKLINSVIFTFSIFSVVHSQCTTTIDRFQKDTFIRSQIKEIGEQLKDKNSVISFSIDRSMLYLGEGNRMAITFYTGTKNKIDLTKGDLVFIEFDDNEIIKLQQAQEPIIKEKENLYIGAYVFVITNRTLNKLLNKKIIALQLDSNEFTIKNGESIIKSIECVIK